MTESAPLGIKLDDGWAPHSVLVVTGELDVYTAPRLREAILKLVADDKRSLVLDLAGVDFLDSTGLGVLVGALKRMKSLDGDLALVGLQARVMKVFEITNLQRVFAIYDTVGDAVRK